MRVKGPRAGGWEGTQDTRAPLSKPQMICSGKQQKQARRPVSLILQGDRAGAEGLVAEPRPKPVPQLHWIFAETWLGTRQQCGVRSQEPKP